MVQPKQTKQSLDAMHRPQYAGAETKFCVALVIDCSIMQVPYRAVAAT